MTPWPRSSSISTRCRCPRRRCYLDLTSFPEVREDLAVVVADDGHRRRRARGRAPRRRAAARAREVFDVYRDVERLGAGNVSLALRLSYRAPTGR